MLDLAGDRLRLRPLVCATPEAQPRTLELILQDDRLAVGVRRLEPGPRAFLLGRIGAPARLGRERGEDRSLRSGGLLQLVDHELGEAPGDRLSQLRAVAQEPVEGEEDVAAVETAGGREDAVVGRDELGELRVRGLG